MLESVLLVITIHGAKNIADAAKLSERHVLEIEKGKTIPSEKALTKLYSAAKTLKSVSESEQALRQRIKAICFL